MTAIAAARELDVFERLYGNLIESWLAELEVHGRPSSLAERVDAEERYGAASRPCSRRPRFAPVPDLDGCAACPGPDSSPPVHRGGR